MTAFDQYRMMRSHHLIFGYRGFLTNELIASILTLTESKLRDLPGPFKKKKSIINIIIEGLQNILYHGEAVEENGVLGHHCIFLMGQRTNEYFIQFGNFISNSHVSALSKKLSYFNSLKQDQVQKLYLDILEKGEITDKGGAGLGILRVIRDSGRTMDFSFVPVDERQSFFCMEIKISM
jgi:hypothetical protein